jgi:hypothetical protein
MKKLFIAMAVGVAALVGGSAANATDNAVRTKDGTGVTQSSTDFSSHRRHWHRYGYYRPYYVAMATIARTTLAMATMDDHTMVVTMVVRA